MLTQRLYVFLLAILSFSTVSLHKPSSVKSRRLNIAKKYILNINKCNAIGSRNWNFNRCIRCFSQQQVCARHHWKCHFKYAHFMLNVCRNGENCQFKHPKPRSVSVSQPQSPNELKDCSFWLNRQCSYNLKTGYCKCGLKGSCLRYFIFREFLPDDQEIFILSWDGKVVRSGYFSIQLTISLKN
jgi:hypothetical protein